MSERRRVSALFNMLVGGISYAVPLLLNLWATPIVLRKLGPEAVGLQSLSAAIIGYMTVAEMGLDVPIVKLIAQRFSSGSPLRAAQVVKAAMVLYAVIGISGGAAIWLMAPLLANKIFNVDPHLSGTAIAVFRISAVGFLATMLVSWGRATCMGFQSYYLSQAISALAGLLGTLVGIFFISAGGDLETFLWSRVAFLISSIACYWLVASRYMRMASLGISVFVGVLGELRYYVGYGILGRLSGAVLGRLDQAVIGAMLGVAALACFSVPVSILSSLVTMIGFIMGFALPRAAELAESDSEVRREFSVLVISVTALIGTAALLPLLLFAPAFFTLWTPDIAIDASRVTQVMAVPCLLNLIAGTSTGSLMLGAGFVREVTFYGILRGTAYALACYSFAIGGDVRDAAMAAWVCVPIDLVYLFVVVPRCLRVSRRELLRGVPVVLLSAGLVALAVLAIDGVWGQPTTWISFFLATICAAVACVILGILLSAKIGGLEGVVGRLSSAFYLRIL